MNVTNLIDQVLARTDNTGPTDADNADRRLRILEYLTEIFTEVWFYSQWRFRRRSVNLTVPALAASVELPADFLDIGPYGSVMRTDGTGVKLDWQPEHIINVSRRSGFQTTTPEQYSIFGQQTIAPYQQLLQIETNPAAVVLELNYEIIPPALDEVANVEKLNLIPASYHQLVLVPGTRYKTQASKGDARSAQSLAEYQRGLKHMKEIERRGKDTLLQISSFFGGGEGAGVFR